MSESSDSPVSARTIAAVRQSHDRFAGLVNGLDENEVQAQAYPSEWSIAQVASHLGSQAEIFDLFLTAGLDGQPAPGPDVFAPIWDRWNALAPAEQVRQSVTANDALVTRLERTAVDDPDGFQLAAFGRDLDLAGLAGMRLGEHTLHTWDIEVALDPAAVLPSESVDLLVDSVPALAGRAGRPVAGADPIVIETTAPDRRFRLSFDPAVELVPVDDGAAETAPLQLSAEALVRMVYGRLDADHTPQDIDDDRLGQVRSAFPGF